MKKIYLLFLLMQVSLVARADESGTFGVGYEDITWTFVESTGTLTISGSGSIPGYIRPEYVPWYNFKDKIKKVVIESGIEYIGGYLFYNCSAMTSVSIPNSVTMIGNYAFTGCSDASITMSSNVEYIGICAFQGCSKLSSVTFSNSLTTIDNYAFSGCSSLTQIIIPSSLTSLGGGVFTRCTSLASITVEEGNPVYDSRNSCNAIIETNINTLISGCKNTVIPNTVVKIGWEAFAGCSGLTSVNIPNSVTTIEGNAFNNCDGLTSLIIPSTVTSIGFGAFGGCNLTSLETHYKELNYEFVSLTNSLQTLVIGAEVNTIDCSYGFFDQCNALTSITVESGNPKYDSRGNCNALIETSTNTLIKGCKNTVIPSTVTTIGEKAFWQCSGLTSINIPNSVTTINNMAFRDCSNVTSITIGNGVSSIYPASFANCRNLESITVASDNPNYDSRDNCNAIIHTNSNRLVAGCMNTVIPDNVSTIWPLAFGGCIDMTSVSIPNSVTEIADYAFVGCNGLTSIYIPQSVTSILDGAFHDCNNLTKVHVGNLTPISILSSVFPNRSNATLYVPKGSIPAYSSAQNWQDFKTIKEYINGDVNQDGEIDVVDVVDIARFVVDTPVESFDEFLADMDGNGVVNIADAVVLVNEIAGDTNFARTRLASTSIQPNNILSLNNEGCNLSLQMEGDEKYAAFQFDLWLPSGMDLMQLSLNNERRQGHQLLYNKLSDGHYRVVVLSTSGRVFNGISGELLGFTLDNFANDEVYMDNIHFVTAAGFDVPYEPVRLRHATILRSPEKTIYDNQPVYNLNGQRLNSPRKGLNIIGGKKIVVK